MLSPVEFTQSLPDLHGDILLHLVSLFNFNLSLLHLLIGEGILGTILFKTFVDLGDTLGDQLDVLDGIGLIFGEEVLFEGKLFDFVLIVFLAFGGVALQLIKCMLFHQKQVFLLLKSAFTFHNLVNFILDLLYLHFKHFSLARDVFNAGLDAG